MEFKAKLVSWSDIENWCLDLKNQIQEKYDPDVIIGMARGGLVPARLLSDYLWIKDLFVVKTEHWGITATVDGTARIKADKSLNVAGRKIVVVDDITDTGGSMRLAHDFVNGLKPAEIKTATMLHIDSSTFVPDFFSHRVPKDDWTWFIWPWNVHEDLLNLTSKILDKPMGTDEILSLLHERFDLVIDRGRLEFLLDGFARSGKMKRVGEEYSAISS